MHIQLENSLKQLIRGRFGPCEMRFYEESVTVTLVRDFGKFAMSDLRVELDNLEVGNYQFSNVIREMLLGAEIVTENRFKLRLPIQNELDSAERADQQRQFEKFSPPQEPDLRETTAVFSPSRKQENLRPQWTDEDRRLEQERRAAATEVRNTIADAVTEAHDHDTLETLLKKEIERDMEDYVLTNLGAAMVLLQKSMRHISLDETKELMRFSYLSGLWKNARERDLQVLVDVFNDHFAKYGQKWSLNDFEGGEG